MKNQEVETALAAVRSGVCPAWQASSLRASARHNEREARAILCQSILTPDINQRIERADLFFSMARQQFKAADAVDHWADDGQIELFG